MRASLRDSLRGQLAEQVRYPKGSIVICTSCAKPIFRLDHAICAGDKGGRSASAFKPITRRDVTYLQHGGPGVDGGLVAAMRAWAPSAITEHLAVLREMRAGDPMLCPACGHVFPQAAAVDKDEVLDRAFSVELVTVPPEVRT